MSVNTLPALLLDGDLVLTANGKDIPVRAAGKTLDVEVGDLRTALRFMRDLRSHGLLDLASRLHPLVTAADVTVELRVGGHTVASAGARGRRPIRVKYRGVLRALFSSR